MYVTALSYAARGEAGTLLSSCNLRVWLLPAGDSLRALVACRRASAGLEYAVFACMLGLTLVIMFQLYGDALAGAITGLSGQAHSAGIIGGSNGH